MTIYSVSTLNDQVSSRRGRQLSVDAQIIRDIAASVKSAGGTMDDEVARVGRLLCKPFVSNQVSYTIDYGQEMKTLCVSATVFGLYDFSVRAECEGADDEADDVVVFSVRHQGVLMRLDYDSLESFGHHFQSFVDSLESKLCPNKQKYAVSYRDSTHATVLA